MKIEVQVKLNAKQESIEDLGENKFLIRLNVPPVDGKANKRIVELLSKHLRIPKTRLELIRGHQSKNKLFLVHSL